MKRVTIKDIARIAGVSYATISRALSGSREVSEQTRARILEICKQEGYRTNALARSLSCNKTNVIGLVGAPVSASQIVSSSIIGVGSAERYKGVKWNVAGKILISWIITVPIAGAIGALLLAVLRFIFL